MDSEIKYSNDRSFCGGMYRCEDRSYDLSKPDCIECFKDATHASRISIVKNEEIFFGKKSGIELDKEITPEEVLKWWKEEFTFKSVAYCQKTAIKHITALVHRINELEKWVVRKKLEKLADNDSDASLKTLCDTCHDFYGFMKRGGCQSCPYNEKKENKNA